MKTDKSSRRSQQPKSFRNRNGQPETPKSAGSVKRWITGWTVTTIIIPTCLLVAALIIASIWNRPQLSVGLAKALVGSERVVATDGVHEFRTVVDLQTPCVAWAVEYTAASERIMPPPEKPIVPRIVYGIYLENTGRTTLTDIRITFRAHEGRFEIESSPQLAADISESRDPVGDTIQTATIAALAPQSRGVLVGSLPVVNGTVSLKQQAPNQYRVDYSLGDIDMVPRGNTHVRFSGTNELSDATLLPISVNRLFLHQRDAYGLDAIRLPIDPVEMSAEGGEGAMRMISAPFMACPDAARDTGYSVPISQRGSDSAVPTATSSISR